MLWNTKQAFIPKSGKFLFLKNFKLLKMISRKKLKTDSFHFPLFYFFPMSDNTSQRHFCHTKPTFPHDKIPNHWKRLLCPMTSKTSFSVGRYSLFKILLPPPSLTFLCPLTREGRKGVEKKYIFINMASDSISRS